MNNRQHTVALVCVTHPDGSIEAVHPLLAQQLLAMGATYSTDEEITQYENWLETQD